MVNDRVDLLIEDLNMSPKSFSDSIGVNTTVIHNIIKGRRSKPSFDLLMKILFRYKDLSADWLIKGEGLMWNRKSGMNSENIPTHVNIEKRIKELVLELKTGLYESCEIYELEELIQFVLNESDAQKNMLVKLNERQEILLNLLKTKLKIKI